MMLVRCVARIPRRSFVARRTLRARVPLFGLLRLLLVAAFGAVAPARAAAPAAVAASCGLSLEIIAAPYAVADSNNPGIQGPRVASLSARLTNTGGAPVTGLRIALGNGTTPGAFTPVGGAGLALLRADDATHVLPDLAPGASVTSYWPVIYPPTFDVAYPYTIWATGDGGGAGLFNSPTAGGVLHAYQGDQQLILDYAVSGIGQFAGYRPTWASWMAAATRRWTSWCAASTAASSWRSAGAMPRTTSRGAALAR